MILDAEGSIRHVKLGILKESELEGKTHRIAAGLSGDLDKRRHFAANFPRSCLEPAAKDPIQNRSSGASSRPGPNLNLLGTRRPNLRSHDADDIHAAMESPGARR